MGSALHLFILGAASMRTWILRAGGLVVALFVWALSTQLSQILPYADCQTKLPWSVIATVLLALTAAAATLCPLADTGTYVTRTVKFINSLSILIGTAFVFALAMQVAASAMINPCQH
jgi:hypothetical protein